MFDPGETAVDAEPEPQILHRLLATTNKGEHLCARQFQSHRAAGFPGSQHRPRSEEHTSELQSQFHLVCRLLLEKKKKKQYTNTGERNTKKQRRERRH